MDKEKLSTQEIVELYEADVQRLMRYLPYLVGKKAKDVSRMYAPDEEGFHSLSFPVYDSTLLAFVKEVQQTAFINYNYKYIYSRYGIKNYKDEWDRIDKATIQEMDLLGGIVSKYVLGGMTKGVLWNEAVEHEIFYRVVEKANELINFWSNK